MLIDRLIALTQPSDQLLGWLAWTLVADWMLCLNQLIVASLLVSSQLFEIHLFLTPHLLVHLLYRLQSGRILVYVQLRTCLVIVVGTFSGCRAYTSTKT